MTDASYLRGCIQRFCFPNELSSHVWRWAMPWWSLLLQGTILTAAIGTLAVIAWRGAALSGIWLLIVQALTPALMPRSLPSQLTQTDRQRLVELSLTPDGPAMWVLTRVRIAQIHALAVTALISVATVAATLRHHGLPGVRLHPAFEIALAHLAIAGGFCFALVGAPISAFSALQILTPQEMLARRLVFGCFGCGACCLFIATVPIIAVSGPCALSLAMITCIGQWRLARVGLPLQANTWSRTQAERATEGERTPWWSKRLW